MERGKRNYLATVFLSLMLGGCSRHNSAESGLMPHYAPVAKGQIEYYQFGKGSPILLILGYATDVSGWSSNFLWTLAENHQLIVLNNRKVGGSLSTSSHYKSADLADDVFQLIHYLRLKKPAVLGISMGGMIAQQVAARHPDDVGQLILINTAISGHQAVHPSPEMEKKMLSLPQNKVGFYLVAVNSFFPSSWKLKMAYRLITDRFLPKIRHEVNLKDIIPRQKTLLMDWSIDDVTAKKISTLTMPVLLLNGKADIVIPPVNTRILLKTIPKAGVIYWKDGGHAMIYQYPHDMAESINRFLLSPWSNGGSLRAEFGVS